MSAPAASTTTSSSTASLLRVRHAWRASRRIAQAWKGTSTQIQNMSRSHSTTCPRKGQTVAAPAEMATSVVSARRLSGWSM